MAELYSAQAAKVEEIAAPGSLKEEWGIESIRCLHEAPAGPVFRAGSVSRLERAALSPLGTALQLGWLVLLVWLTGSLLRLSGRARDGRRVPSEALFRKLLLASTAASSAVSTATALAKSTSWPVAALLSSPVEHVRLAGRTK